MHTILKQTERVSIVAFWGKKNRDIETREGREKPGPIRRIWRKFRNINWEEPVNRWKLLFACLAGCIVIFGGGYGVIAFTNSPSFCASCHEMTPEHSTYIASSHSQISCVQCHIKPGFTTMMIHKMKSMKEVYYHITGVPNQIVQTEEEAVSNQNCLQCHSRNRIVTASGDLKVNHNKHIDEGIPCITCHAGVVHSNIASRKLNVGDKERNLWTSQKNAQKLMDIQYSRPNMGTCIDCHEKVNKGEKPWKDITYSLPENPEATASAKEKSVTAENTASKKSTQQLILESINGNSQKTKISMACSTCHREVGIPKDHRDSNWNNTHGTEAVNNINNCVACHQDSKWVKRISAQDITALLHSDGKTQQNISNLITAKEAARNNTFCNSCHGQRPQGHLTSDIWLTAHASKAKTNVQKAECYICHDRTKPNGTAANGKAPTDVYCQNCHRTGFKGESKQ